MLDTTINGKTKIEITNDAITLKVEEEKIKLSVEEIVDSLSNKQFIIDLFKNDIKAARDEIRLVCSSADLDYYEAFVYFWKLYKKTIA